MIADALLLGLTTGSSCLTTCVPVVLPFLLSENPEKPGGNTKAVFLFLGGRFGGYILTGFILGLLGAYTSSFLPPEWSRTLSRVMFTIAGIIMLFLGIMYNFPKKKMCQKLSRIHRSGRSALIIGFITGLSLCPPFFAAAARVFGRQSSLGGALYFALFFLGTSVYFLPLLGLNLFKKRMETIRMIARVSLLLFGIYFIVFIGILGVIS